MKESIKSDLFAAFLIGGIICCLTLLAFSLFSGEPDWVITSGEGMPVKLVCMQDEAKPIEVEFCAAFADKLLESGSVKFVTDEDVYLDFIVIPVERDGYLSVSMASNLVFPPLGDPVLSVYFGGFIILPGAHTDDEALKFMSDRIIVASAQWVMSSQDWLLQFKPPDYKPAMEAKND